jgi:type II secretory pathway component PulF
MAVVRANGFSSGFSAKFKTAWMIPEGVARRLFFLERKRLLRRLQVMARAHLPLAESISELRERAYTSKKGIMYAALSSMEQRQRRGRTVAETFAGWIPENQIMLMEAGERSGYEAFALAIEDALSLQGATSEMIGRVIGGLMEPFLLITANYFLVLWMASNFTDKVFKMLHINPDQLTGQAHQFYTVGVFAKSYWAWLAPTLIMAAIVALFVSLPMATGKWRRPLDRFVPPWSVYRSINGAGWMLTFAKLASARYSYEDILRRTADLSRPWLRSRIMAIEYWVRRGRPLGEAMRKSENDFPSRDLVDDIATFNNRPGFEEALDILAKEWVSQTSQQVKGLAFAMTGIGWMVTGFVMIWIFTAFDAMQTQITAIARQMMH